MGYRAPRSPTSAEGHKSRRDTEAPITLLNSNRPLLDAFRRGDREAMTTVYLHYVGLLETLVRRGFHLDALGVTVAGVSSRSEQRDLIQETFARAFRERARLAYDGLSPYRPYLLRIAKNLLIDRVRKLNREPAIAVDDATLDQVVFEEGEELDRDPEWQQLAAASRDFIGTLSEPDRRFVQLRFDQELSQRDCAAALGWTRRKVRSIEDELRIRLSRYLDQRAL